MTDCDLQQSAPGKWQCEECGWTYRGDRAPKRNCSNPPDFAPLVARLAEETKHPEILDSPQLYHQAVIQCAAKDFSVRESEDYKYIVDVLCPGCRHYRATSCTCGTCGGKGQLIAVKAWMDTDTCPAMRW